MANIELSPNPEFNTDMVAFKTDTPVHADEMNGRFRQLLDNEKVISLQMAENTGSCKKAYTVIIGTALSGHTEKDCDYLCTGVDDQETILEALSEVNAYGGGGKVLLLNGTYHLSDCISLPIGCSNITIKGMGSSTLIKKEYNLTVTANEDYDGRSLFGVMYCESVENVTFRDFCIDGNKTNYMDTVDEKGGFGTQGIALYNSNHIEIRNVKIINTNQYAIYIDNSKHIDLNQNTLKDDRSGIAIAGSSYIDIGMVDFELSNDDYSYYDYTIAIGVDYDSSYIVIDNNHIFSNSLMSLTGSHIQVINNKMGSKDKTLYKMTPIILSGCRFADIIGNEIFMSSGENFIYAYSSFHSNIKILNNGFYGDEHNNRYIYLYTGASRTSADILISNNIMSGHPSGYGICIARSNDVIISDNIMEVNTGIYLNACSKASIDNNDIIGCNAGYDAIVLTSSSFVNTTNNTMDTFRYISLDSSSTNNRVDDNTLINTRGIIDSGSNNTIGTNNLTYTV